MSKEKQIEEIMDVIMGAELVFPKANLPLLDIEKYIAEHLYNAGYRKQSEGRWMVYHCTNGGHSQKGRTIIYKTYTCDACGKSSGRHKTNFCPNCGAKMKGV